MLAVDVRLLCIKCTYFHGPPSGHALPVKVSDSVIIRSSMSPGGKCMYTMFLSKMVIAMIFRMALKAVGKNYENMSLKIHNFSTMQNIRIQYELYEGLHGPKRTDTAAL